ncbi:hypothetical protein LPJ66_005879, partial [Kickxella alabastrina]
AKEGRGCDQCIARLFGREALESPPSTIHKILSRSRHSLDPGALIQSLSALTMGGGNSRQLIMDSPIQEEEYQCKDSDRHISVDFLLPAVANVVVKGSSDIPFQFGCLLQSSTGESTPADSARSRSMHSATTSIASSRATSANMVSAYYAPARPSTPLLSSTRTSINVDRTSSVSEPSSLQSASSNSRTNRLSVLLARRLSRHSSTGSAMDWESLPGSARSTLLCETSPTSVQPSDSNSPMSTILHNRVSFVSSSCSTVVSDSSQRIGRSRARRPIAFSTDGSQPSAADQPKPAISRSLGNGHCSLLALYENPAAQSSTALQSSLVSNAAPPKLSLIQAEATAARSRKKANATLCSLCHGDFDMQDSQHQCASCLSLVCPRCISHKRMPTSGLTAVSPGLYTANFSRILSMYIPEGYDQLSGGLMCDSCAAHPSSIDSNDDDDGDDGDDASSSKAVYARSVMTEG